MWMPLKLLSLKKLKKEVIMLIKVSCSKTRPPACQMVWILYLRFMNILVFTQPLHTTINCNARIKLLIHMASFVHKFWPGMFRTMSVGIYINPCVFPGIKYLLQYNIAPYITPGQGHQGTTVTALTLITGNEIGCCISL